MRKLFLLTAAAAAAASFLIAQAPKASVTASTTAAKSTKSTATKSTKEAPLTPRKAGEFVIHTPEGKELLLSSYRGKVVVLAFMYTTCPHCQHMAGILTDVQKRYGPLGAQVLGVAFDLNAKRDVAVFAKTFGTLNPSAPAPVNFPMGYSDEASVLKFMHSGPEYFVPMLAFIDRTGVVRSQHIGDEFFRVPEQSVPNEVAKYLAVSVSKK